MLHLDPQPSGRCITGGLIQINRNVADIMYPTKATNPVRGMRVEASPPGLWKVISHRPTSVRIGEATLSAQSTRFERIQTFRRTYRVCVHCAGNPALGVWMNGCVTVRKLVPQSRVDLEEDLHRAHERHASVGCTCGGFYNGYSCGVSLGFENVLGIQLEPEVRSRCGVSHCVSEQPRG